MNGSARGSVSQRTARAYRKQFSSRERRAPAAVHERPPRRRERDRQANYGMSRLVVAYRDVAGRRGHLSTVTCATGTLLFLIVGLPLLVSMAVWYITAFVMAAGSGCWLARRAVTSGCGRRPGDRLVVAVTASVASGVAPPRIPPRRLCLNSRQAAQDLHATPRRADAGDLASQPTDPDRWTRQLRAAAVANAQPRPTRTARRAPGSRVAASAGSPATRSAPRRQRSATPGPGARPSPVVPAGPALSARRT